MKKLIVVVLLIIPCLAWGGRRIFEIGTVRGSLGAKVRANVVKSKRNSFYLSCVERHSITHAIVGMNEKQIDQLIKLLQESKKELAKP